MRTTIRFSLILAGIAGAVSGCQEDRPATSLRSAKDVILVTLDTTRFDHTSLADPSLGNTSLGSDNARRTPFLAALAADGVVFTRAYSPVPVTLPAHASALSGRSPLVHGLRMNGTRQLDASIPLAAERFSSAGFRTGAFVSSVVLEPRYGLARGFETYDTPGPGQRERRGDASAAAAIRWLDAQDRQDRVFLWLHLYDAHLPYDPPAAYRDRPPYDGEIAAADAALGALVAALKTAGRLDDAIVIVAADHGEGLGDHIEEEHGILLYEEAIHVPMVARLPGRFGAGRKITSVVRLMDLAPTLLARAEVPGLGETEGVDLTPYLNGASDLGLAAYAESHVGAEVHGFAPIHAWIEGPWKFIEAPSPELYELTEDPGERVNRVGRDTERVATLAAAMHAMRGALETRTVAASEVPVDAEQTAMLRELGYVGGVAGGHGSGMDPKDGIRIHNLLREANAILAAGRAQDALQKLQDAKKRDPGNRSIALLEARIVGHALGRRPDARDGLSRFLAADARFLEGWLLLGELFEDGRAADSALCFQKAVAIAPDNYEARYNFARATELTGDLIAARVRYEETLAVARKPAALNALAWLLSTSPPPVRDPALALNLAEEAVAAEPTNPEYLDTLAEARSASGDHAGAVEAMQRAIKESGRPRPDFEERLARFRIFAGAAGG